MGKKEEHIAFHNLPKSVQCFFFKKECDDMSKLDESISLDHAREYYNRLNKRTIKKIVKDSGVRMIEAIKHD